QLLAAACVDRPEPAVHRPIENNIARGGQHAAVKRQLALLYAPDWPRPDGVPGDELAVIAAGPSVHANIGAEIGRARNVVRFNRLVVHAGVVRWDVDQPGAW